jgi:hypothetical protein
MKADYQRWAAWSFTALVVAVLLALYEKAG